MFVMYRHGMASMFLFYFILLPFICVRRIEQARDKRGLHSFLFLCFDRAAEGVEQVR